MYSFDVFDTLITRNTATPHGIFALMQDKMEKDKDYTEMSSYIKENFFNLRIHAEELARVNYAVAGAEDVTLEQIYEAMRMTGCLSLLEAELLMKLERTLEYENIIGIEENIVKVKQLIEAGQKVVLISDMYLDAVTIRKLLVKANPIFSRLPLYVSSEYKRNKASGGLYEIVRVAEKTDFNQWTHFGDNIHSDVYVANQLGIKAEHFRFEALLEWETQVLKDHENDASRQLLIGTARNTRLKESFSEPGMIGCSIGGAVLFPYVWWLLQESRRRGIKRLYFIARDGFVLKKLADIVIEQYRYGISTHYIYGSRKAWRMPSVSAKNCDVYKLIGWSHTFNIQNITDLAEVLQLPVHEFVRFLPIQYQDAKQKISPLILFLLTIKLSKNIKFKEYLCSVHKETRANVIAYLQQEVDFSDDLFAFVDLAGGGLTQGCLAEIISDFYDKKVQTFFFKLDRIHLMDNNICYDFLPSSLHLNLILEMLCRAPHGQTEGYCETENGTFVPVLKAGEEKALIDHGFNDYFHGMELFVENYVTVLKNSTLQENKVNVLLKYLEYITKAPNKEVLNFFAGMPNSVTGREKKVMEFAPMLSRKQLRYFYLFHMQHDPLENFYKGSALEYSLLRCSPNDQRKIKFYKKNRKCLLDRFKKLNQKEIRPEYKNYRELANIFPVDLLEPRVVLYGAGKMGQLLYNKISKLHMNSVVQWVDGKYDTYQQKGLPVIPVSEIGKVEYDQIIIAISNEVIAENIRKSLKIQAIPNEKIVGVNLFITWV